MNQVIIGVGSNIDPRHNIQQATDLIRECFHLVAVSQFRETKPVGVTNQPNFLNGAVLIRTPLDPVQLKSRLRQIEDRLERQREAKNGPRTIDLDIMVWNGKVVDPEVMHRDFLQAAIEDVDPEITLS
jgi:2-amino-4-hydroxy-6-hydroxymethyldihydropteridine diphosphokinase